jgi:hypothetical protein
MRDFSTANEQRSDTASERSQKPGDELQIAVDVRNGPKGAFDWRREMGRLDVDLKNSSVEFSTYGR